MGGEIFRLKSISLDWETKIEIFLSFFQSKKCYVYIGKCNVEDIFSTSSKRSPTGSSFRRKQAF